MTGYADFSKSAGLRCTIPCGWCDYFNCYLVEPASGEDYPLFCCTNAASPCKETEAQQAKVQGCKEKIVNYANDNLKLFMYVSIGAILLQVCPWLLKKIFTFNLSTSTSHFLFPLLGGPRSPHLPHNLPLKPHPMTYFKLFFFYRNKLPLSSFYYFWK